MLGVTHFAVGACVGLVGARLCGSDSDAVPVLAGLWAMAPDANKLVSADVLDAYHGSVWANANVGHHAMDLAETAHPTAEGAVALGALTAAAIATDLSVSRPQ